MNKHVKHLTILGISLFFVITFSGCVPSYYTASDVYYDNSPYNPNWAPDYYSGARYYYFPDIESYYDISSRDFIVLRNGQWVFVRELNPYYPSYNLYNSFIVVVNVNVYQPWMHHQYYNSHYPRYYYRDYYDHSNIPYVRGFNENRKSAIYWAEKDRNKARAWDDRDVNNRKFSYSSEDKRVQRETTERVMKQRSSSNNSTGSRTSTRTSTTRTSTSTSSNGKIRTESASSGRNTKSGTNRETTSRDSSSRTNTQRSSDNSNTEKRRDTNYYGKTIGRPVKVERQMRNTETTRSSRSTNTTTKSSRSSGRSTNNSSTSRSNSSTSRRTN